MTIGLDIPSHSPVPQVPMSSAVLSLPYALRAFRRFEFPHKLGVMEKVFGNRLAQNGVCWVTCSNGVVWKLDLNEATHRWIVYGQYEGGVGIAFARTFLSDGGVFVDSGANIGQWLLFLGSIPGLRAFEFEPVDDQRRWLEDCLVRQNEWSCTCEVMPFGLGASERDIDIQCDGPRSTTRLDWFQGRNLLRQRIIVKRLDDVMSAAGVERIDFWKLDVEGSEDDALRGAERYLVSRMIRAIQFECNPANFHWCKSYLEGCGYQLYVLGSRGPRLFEAERIEAMQDLVALPKDAKRR